MPSYQIKVSKWQSACGFPIVVVCQCESDVKLHRHLCSFITDDGIFFNRNFGKMITNVLVIIFLLNTILRFSGVARNFKKGEKPSKVWYNPVTQQHLFFFTKMQNKEGGAWHSAP